ncbi:YggS family pyridoxal phosphate-dependent enzyme [Desulfovibrio sp. OttesenSCG-928-C06]|nr:YggS family pyridoxal phosphate-dependent enzyme [Desulfovibrio sp. OttesenSCG-928-C06]
MSDTAEQHPSKPDNGHAEPSAASSAPLLPLPEEEEKKLQQRFDSVTDRLRAAIAKSGRPGNSVALVAVSKWHSASMLAALARYWQKRNQSGALGSLAEHGVIFAENYMQEAMQKQDALTALPDMANLATLAALDDESGKNFGISWHFSGPLQSKKAKYVVGRFAMLQTMSTLSLAQNLHKVLDQRSREIGSPQLQPVLVQVNIGEEEQKSGVAPKETLTFIKTLQTFTSLSVQGLMCLPPYSENAEDSRQYFVKLRQLRDSIEKETGLKLPHLSMGMSHDFEIAVEEGATMVRVGTDIFGEREY